MKEINNDAQDRYLKEMAVRLVHAGVMLGTASEDSLPIKYGDAYLCRVSGKGVLLMQHVWPTQDPAREARKKVGEKTRAGAQ